VLGCGDAVAPLPAGAVRMDPLPQYQMWWQFTEQCSGLTGDMSTIQWFRVPATGTLNDDHADGIFYTESRRIVLAGDSIASGQLVRHEMLHALGATPGHPAAYFQDRCGGIVDCQAACLSDGGTVPVDSAGSFVDPMWLLVTTKFEPIVPIKSHDTWAALTIRIENPFPEAVRVHLTPVSGTKSSETFGYKYAPCSAPNQFHLPVYDWIDGDVFVIGPHAVKQRMFDIGDWNSCRVLTPFFNRDTLARLVIDPIIKASRSATTRDR
jgi:hypothetical protein